MRLYVLSLSVVLTCVRMSAANIVQDPGFEVGGSVTCNGSAACGPIHPAWTFINAASGTDYGVDVFDPHSGTNAAFMAGVTAGSFDVIQQTLTTTPGQFYTLSFWLDTHFNHSNADFQVFWNGTLIYDDPAGTDATHQFNYTLKSFPSLQATGASTVLKFAGYNVPSADYFDDVSVDTGQVAAVPEPAGWFLSCTGILAIAVRRLLRR
jgi:hypothetical protein